MREALLVEGVEALGVHSGGAPELPQASLTDPNARSLRALPCLYQSRSPEVVFEPAERVLALEKLRASASAP